jgi:hypothetical protein
MAKPITPIAVLRQLAARLVLAALVLLVVAPNAVASVGVGSNAASPRLRVDAKGNAEISYVQGGSRMTVLVPKTGAVVYGSKLSGRDVSRAASKPALQFMKVLRKAPGGWFYALQTWPTRSGPAELRFSRWRGAPTKLTLAATQEHFGIALQGKVTYDGKPIPIRSRAPGGVAVREYVYIEQRVGGQWQIVGGIAVKSNGTYRRMLNGGATGSLFRATVAGPNVGAVYAPDVVVQIPPP